MNQLTPIDTTETSLSAPSEERAEDMNQFDGLSVQPLSDGNKPAKRKRRGIKSTLAGLLSFILGGIVVIAILFFSFNVVVGDWFGAHEVCGRFVTEVDLRGSEVQKFSQLSQLKKMETVNLTDTSFDDLTALYGCRSLKKVILTDQVMPAGECAAFYEACPAALLQCRVALDGQEYDSAITALRLTDADEKVQRMAAAFPALESLDLTECTVSDETYDYLTARLPDCLIQMRVTIGGTVYTTDAAAIVLKGNVAPSDVAALRYFGALEMIDARECTDTAQLDKIAKEYPHVSINRPVSFLGLTVGTEDTLIDLRGQQVTLEDVKAALDENLPRLKALKKIDMCGCGLGNSQMEQLCEAYPSIKFVWIVNFQRWSVRTDAVIFAALNSNGEEIYSEYDYAPLFKYCTDLRALDLGHSVIQNISGVASMKKLRSIILTDNLITDISAFSELHDLEFIEMNINRVRSAEPLRDLQQLRYLDFWSSKQMTDLSPLYHHDKLEIAIFHKTVEQDERDRFIASNPNCDTYFKVDSMVITTNERWRENEYRVKLKAAFKDWKYVVGFDEATGEYIFDYQTDQYRF